MARKKANPGQSEQAAERRVRAIELRKAGLGYRQISEQLGVSVQQAWRDVQKALADLAKMEQDHAREYRQLELERLDALLSPLWLRARGRRIQHDDGTVEDVPPDYAAVDRVMRLMEARRRLLGLDVQPEDKDHEVIVRVVHEAREKGGADGS